MTLEQLQSRYSAGKVKFVPGDMPYLEVSTALAQARVYLQGAHVSHFQPAGEKPVLFMSSKSHYQPGKPLRGGVPICWPWFGAKADDPTAPMHGIARLQEWTVASISELPGGEIGIILELLPSDLSRKYWPTEFHLEHRIRIGRELSMSLVTRNTGTEPFAIAEALHSYFSVGDVRNIRITGLENAHYIDKTKAGERAMQGAEPITISAELDRLYLNTLKTVTIHDPACGRKIHVAKTASQSTVVWNPWIAKSAAMPDFGDDEWPGMVCVETANAADNCVSVAPNSESEMQAIITVEKL